MPPLNEHQSKIELIVGKETKEKLAAMTRKRGYKTVSMLVRIALQEWCERNDIDIDVYEGVSKWGENNRSKE